MKQRTQLALLSFPFVATLVIILVLQFLAGCASPPSARDLTVCRCISDLECAVRCGGNGDPTPRSK